MQDQHKEEKDKLAKDAETNLQEKINHYEPIVKNLKDDLDKANKLNLE